MNKNRHLISKYLEGELDAITAARFEEDLKRDPILRSEMELYKEVDEALADTEIQELRMQLEDIHSLLTPQILHVPRKGVKLVSRIAVAASLAALISFSVIGLRQYYSGQKVLEKYYQPYEVSSINRSSIIEPDVDLRNAFEKYQNQQYRDALHLFERVLEKNPGQITTQFYAGISYFEIEEYMKAGKSFSVIIDHKDNLYIEQAKWFLGFCYLKTNEKEKALRQFTEIANSNSSYSERAKAILKRLW